MIFALTKNDDFHEFQKKIKEKSSNQRETTACSTSHPSGNQVDGLPLVAHICHIQVHAKSGYDPYTK